MGRMKSERGEEKPPSEDEGRDMGGRKWERIRKDEGKGEKDGWYPTPYPHYREGWRGGVEKYYLLIIIVAPISVLRQKDIFIFRSGGKTNEGRDTLWRKKGEKEVQGKRRENGKREDWSDNTGMAESTRSVYCFWGTPRERALPCGTLVEIRCSPGRREGESSNLNRVVESSYPHLGVWSQ